MRSIKIKENRPANYVTEEKEYTFKELLEIFDNDTNFVKPLVLLVQELDKEIKQLNSKKTREENKTRELFQDLLKFSGHSKSCSVPEECICGFDKVIKKIMKAGY